MSYKDYLKKKRDYSGVLKDSSIREIQPEQSRQIRINKPSISKQEQSKAGNQNGGGGSRGSLGGGGGSRGSSQTGNDSRDAIRDEINKRMNEASLSNIKKPRTRFSRKI